MAAANFGSGVTPTWVTPLEPEFHNIITPMESMKKNYMNVSGSTPVFRYKLVWNSMTDAKFWALYNHFYSAKGGYDSFLWTSVPAYIDANHDGTADGADMTGRWVAGSFKFQLDPKSWKAEIIFEEKVV